MVCVTLRVVQGSDEVIRSEGTPPSRALALCGVGKVAHQSPPVGNEAPYRIPQPLQVRGLQHECVKHLLCLPPHIQQN